MILDTSFIIDLLKNRRESVSKMKQLTEDGVPYMITAPTVFELWSGLVSLGKSETEKQKTVSLIREQIIYPLDEESARIAGNIDGELIKKGESRNLEFKETLSVKEEIGESVSAFSLSCVELPCACIQSTFSGLIFAFSI